MLFSNASLLAVVGIATAIPYVSAFGNHLFRKREPFEPRQTPSTSTSDYSTEYWFDQLLDHSNPAAGTFKQRYFFSDQYYKGQGAPIVIGTPGEQSADGFHTDLTGSSVMNAMLQLWGAAGVVLEHRYWGKSSPFPQLTAPNLQYLSVQQAIDDYKYFVETVGLPWAAGPYISTPDATPWVNIGCSYPGLLVAYTQEKYPDLFAAGWATSAPVNADGDFWEYWEPIEEGMPANCSADLAAAVNYMDNIMTTGTPEAVTAMKAKFGLESLANDDFAAVLQYPINTWQDLQAYDFYVEGTSLFYQFCDAIETNADGTQNLSPQGVGMPQAFENWATVLKALGPDANCPGTGGACYSSADPNSAQYSDTTVSDTYMRAWVWLLCTELGWFQVGDLGNSSTIISSQLTPAYFQRQCAYYFPLADGTHSTYDFSQAVTEFNTQFKGWNVVGNNLFVVNGEFDPWRSASLSSKWAPSFVDTPTQEIVVVPNGHHCWDFYVANGQVDNNVKAIQQQGYAEITSWLRNWYNAHPSVTNHLDATTTTVADAGPDTTDDTTDDIIDDTTDDDDTIDDTADDDDDTIDDTTDDDDTIDDTADDDDTIDDTTDDTADDTIDDTTDDTADDAIDDTTDDTIDDTADDTTDDTIDDTADDTTDDTIDDTADDTTDDTIDDTADDTTDDTIDDLDAQPDEDGPDNNIANDAGSNDAADELQTNGNNNNSNNNDDASDLKSKIDELASNKRLAMISFIINGVLALLVIGCLIWLILTKRKANKATPAALPRWVGGGGRGIHEGDQLGEYGSGSSAGGRGQYQQLKDQGL